MSGKKRPGLRSGARQNGREILFPFGKRSYEDPKRITRRLDAIRESQMQKIALRQQMQQTEEIT